MGFAIGFFNLIQGQFFGYMLAHYTSVLSNPGVLAALTCSETLLGSFLGWAGFILSSISTTMLFLKYFVSGVVKAVEPQEQPDPKEQYQHNRGLFVAIGSFITILASCYSPNLWPWVAPIVNMLVPYLYPAGSLAIIPALALTTAIIGFIGFIHIDGIQPQGEDQKISDFLIDLFKAALISAVSFFTLNSVVGVAAMAIPATWTTFSTIAKHGVIVFGTVLYLCQVQNVVELVALSTVTGSVISMPGQPNS